MPKARIGLAVYQFKFMKTSIEKPELNLLSRKKVAERFGVCPHTVQRWERAGRISGIKINSRVIRYRPEEIEQLARGVK